MVGRASAPIRDRRTRCPDAPWRQLLLPITARPAPRRMIAPMSPQPAPRSRAPRRRSRQGPGQRRLTVHGVLLLLAGLVCLAACAPSFNPNGPCSRDGSEPGAYPELEALVPSTFRGTRPHQIDSGRTCTADGLGTLAGHGISEIRFAGSTWETGTDSALTLATFTTPAGPTLTAPWL